ncbi:selenophosphate synthase [Rubritalea squalenifaciens DSM 18772]|uniref:Selenide, water dikinase n=1 Tax=Rubritalea squalenifaciens DSM 18772 TaxID=1123071 RepID=A0A1M6IX86_9BACT|nr:selenophosphate synthase [Rubritalea squalenifaciens DSM 18772]
MPQYPDPNLLVGSSTADDAGVYRLNDETSLVQTLDFFTPIVDDPYLFGRIAATNSLSDVYAMGGRPITAMAIAGMPDDLLSNEDIAEVFRGGADMVAEAQCSLVGGHTIKNPQPIYGLSVTGLVHTENFLANAHCKPGDTLILTKPLGTGIISTAVKRGICPDELQELAIQAMTTLNRSGATLADKKLVNGCTDITGFGFLGHLAEMMKGSNTSAEIDTNSVPALSPLVMKFIEEDCVPGGSKKNLLNIAPSVNFGDNISEAVKLLMADAQTSGGLLLSVPPENEAETLDILANSEALCVSIVGQVTNKQAHDIFCS